MQLNQKQQKFEAINQLLNAQDPDEFLINLFASFTKDDKEDFELCKMHLHHLRLKKQISKITHEIQQIKETLKLNTLQTTPRKLLKDNQNQQKHESSLYSNQNTIKPKRARRAANQIKRHFTCPIQNCNKQYGSEGSLNQHIKMKHENLQNSGENRTISPQIQIKSSS